MKYPAILACLIAIWSPITLAEDTATGAVVVTAAQVETDENLPNRAFHCAHQGLNRLVLIEYPLGSPVPCRVFYDRDKDTPDESQMLWHALNEEGFCEGKAEILVDQLGRWGWSCREEAQ